MINLKSKPASKAIRFRAAKTHLENHRYWWTKSKETQSEGLQWELKVGRFKDKKKKNKKW